MKTQVRISQYAGLSLEDVEAWDYHPETEESKALGLSYPCLEVHFTSGRTRKVYGSTADSLFELLNDNAFPLYLEKE